VCTRPPSCKVLSEKLNDYLKRLSLPPSGIDMIKEKFPNRDWLVLAVATLSEGNDEIFDKGYVPTQEQLRRDAVPPLRVHNNDGVLDVPEALRDKTKKRALRMITLTKEDRIEA